MKKNQLLSLVVVAALGASLIGCGNSSDSASLSEGSVEINASSAGETIELTNVSYDPTRELYAAYNELFAKHYQEEFGQTVEVTQSHGGSGKQAL